MALSKMAFIPADGLRDAITYPDPATETIAREQIQGRLDEIKNYLNNTLTTEADSTFATAENLDRAIGFYSDLAAWYGNTKLIANCEADEGWVAHSSGTLAIDTTNYKVGSGAIKLTGSANTHGIALVKALDLTVFNGDSASSDSDYIVFPLYIDATSLTNLGFAYLQILFINDAYGTINNFKWTAKSSTSLVAGWNFLKLLKSSFSTVGSGAWSGIQWICFRIGGTPSGTVSATIDNIQLVRKDPLINAPNPFQRLVNGVWTRDFTINAGEWFIGLEFGEIVWRNLKPGINGYSNTASALVGTKSYTDFTIRQSCKVKEAGHSSRPCWEIDANNRIFACVADNILYLDKVVNASVTHIGSAPLSVAVGDRLDFTLQRKGNTVMVEVVKNGDINNPVMLSGDVSFSQVGYLAISEYNCHFTVLHHAITTTEHAHHADVAEVAKEAVHAKTADSATSATTATTASTANALAGNWQAWTPTLTWFTATPASLFVVARYTEIGKTVYFNCYINSTDSNGTTNLAISLPKAPKNNTSMISLSAIQKVGTTSPTYTNPLAYISDSTSQIKFFAFSAGIDGQDILISITGFYEVA